APVVSGESVRPDSLGPAVQEPGAPDGADAGLARAAQLVGAAVADEQRLARRHAETLAGERVDPRVRLHEPDLVREDDRVEEPREVEPAPRRSVEVGRIREDRELQATGLERAQHVDDLAPRRNEGDAR